MMFELKETVCLRQDKWFGIFLWVAFPFTLTLVAGWWLADVISDHA